MPNNIIRQDYGTVGTDVQTQMLIAPVLAEMKADRQFAVGDQFIVDSVLYKITTAISVIGTPLVVDSNCEVSDSITQQTKGNIIKQVLSDGVKSYNQLLSQFESAIAGMGRDIGKLKIDLIQESTGNKWVFPLSSYSYNNQSITASFAYNNLTSSSFLCTCLKVSTESSVNTRLNSTYTFSNQTFTISDQKDSVLSAGYTLNMYI